MSSVYSNMKMKFGNKLKVPWLSTTASQKRQGKDKQVEAPTKKDALMGLQNLPQPQLTRFEGANPWQPEEHVVLYCMNNQDNVPARMKLDNEFVYYISQSRSPGHKDQGQDCMSSAKHKDWEVHVLCDGHDKLGHMVALGVCQQLPKIVLRMIHERENAGAVVADSLLANAFDECAKVVCWTSEGITVGIWVKVFEGQWADKPGYIKESTGAGKVRVAIIDENGYHLPPIDRKSLRRPRYTGGCTCVCLVRNRVTNEWKVAVSGDSRSVIMPCKGVNDAVLLRQAGVVTESSTKPIPEGLITPAHNVFNVDERDRLEKSYPGQYEVDGNFLVNPITKFAIQPTRGFGDFDMFGTGYTHVPQISKTFKLEPNSLIFTASDGVFDTHVWQDEEIVSCLDKYIEEGLTSAQIVENMYRETLQRSLEGGYVDDISIFCYKTPGDASVKEKEELTEELVVPNPTLIKKRKDTKDKRRTIGRNGDSYTDLSTQVLELKKKKMNISKDAVDVEDEKLDNLAKDDKEAEATVEGVGRLMKNIAIAQGLDDFKGVDPKDLASGRSFSAGDGSNDDGEENFNAAEP